MKIVIVIVIVLGIVTKPVYGQEPADFSLPECVETNPCVLYGTDDSECKRRISATLIIMNELIDNDSSSVTDGSSPEDSLGMQEKSCTPMSPENPDLIDTDGDGCVDDILDPPHTPTCVEQETKCDLPVRMVYPEDGSIVSVDYWIDTSVYLGTLSFRFVSPAGFREKLVRVRYHLEQPHLPAPKSLDSSGYLYPEDCRFSLVEGMLLCEQSLRQVWPPGATKLWLYTDALTESVCNRAGTPTTSFAVRSP